MKLYNKGGRALILPPAEVISGGRFQQHDRKKEKAYFDPSKDIEVSEAYGDKLLGMYPEMLVKMDGNTGKQVKRKSKKSVNKE